MTSPLLFIVGLTGVGKSTTLSALHGSGVTLTLLPNRRDLTDRLIIPEMQRERGEPEAPVKDRLERFALTKRYREKYAGGMVYALERYLMDSVPTVVGTMVFDNLRGLEEVQAAVEAFPDCRFIFLDAPFTVRLLRLVERQDDFDKVGAVRLENTAFLEALESIKGAAETFDLYEVGRLEASGYDGDALLDAVRIIVTERQNYDSATALSFLRERLDDTHLLCLDTGSLGIDEVTRRIQAWLLSTR